MTVGAGASSDDPKGKPAVTLLRYARAMRFLLPALLLPALLLAQPALAVPSGHEGGAPHRRTMPEASDLALAVMAAGGVWLVRRALRARFAKRRRED